MRVDFDVTGIDHEPFKVGLIDQFFQQRLPDALVAPANEAAMGVAPSAIVRRQVPPRRAGAQDPKHRVNKLSIVLRPASPNPFPSRQMRFEEFPGSVVDVVAAVGERYGVPWVRFTQITRFSTHCQSRDDTI